MKILLVEDDESLADMLMQLLRAQHYHVDLATDGQTGWEMATSFSYDLLLLDVMLPVLDGISFCKQRRAAGDLTPILLLTALDLSTSKVTGLDSGADDYVVKPFNPDELLARIRALLRRGHPNSLPVMQWGNLHLDPSSCQVTCDEQPIHLTSKEYELLELFLRNHQRIFSSSALIDRLWSFDEFPTESTVRTHIKGLRRKLKEAGVGDMIETIYSFGYRLREESNWNKLSIKKNKSKERSHTASELCLHSNNTQPFAESSPPSTSLSPNLAELWQLHQEKYFSRIEVLDQALIALQQGCLSTDLRENAQQQAHTLAGALGSFGFDEASRLSYHIEQLFKTNTTLQPGQVQQLATWIKQLQQKLVQSGTTATLNQRQSIDRLLHLLIVNHNAELAATLAAEASEWGMLATTAMQLHQARSIIDQVLPDAIVLDLNFPDSSKPQLDFLAELMTEQPSIPAIVLIEPESFVSLKEEAKYSWMQRAHLGGRKFLQKPVSFTQIMKTMKQVLHLPPHPLSAICD